MSDYFDPEKEKDTCLILHDAITPLTTLVVSEIKAILFHIYVTTIVKFQHNNYKNVFLQWNVFKTIVTFWRVKNKQKRFLKWAGGSSLFWTELQILGEA